MAISGLAFVCFVFLALVGAAAPCSVDLRAWGYDDTVLDGYIRVNGQLKVNSTQPGPPNGPDLHTRGINTVLLNIATCTTSDLRNFDTYLRASDSDLLVNYLQSLPAGSVLLGVTFDEASIQLTPAAVQALTSIGANVTSLVFRGKFLFIAEIGCSSLTKFKIGQNGGDNLLLSADVPALPDENAAYTCGTCSNPCTAESAAAEKFYFKHTTQNHFVQCSQYRRCYVMPCSPGLVWYQSKLTCDWP